MISFLSGYYTMVAHLSIPSYAVSHTNAFSPAAAWYLPFYLCFVFALCERKNETQKEGEVPLRTITSDVTA
jgi:hypothetical protein